MTRHDKRMTPAEARVRLELWPTDGLRDILNGLAVAVRNKRKATGQSVRAVGAELGIPWNCVSRTERRIGEPSVATFIALVRWLDVPGWGECEYSLRSAGTVEPEDERPIVEQLAAALTEGRAIVCYTRCYACQFGHHFDPPEPHTWGAEDDFEHARATGQPDPGNCGCSCAQVPQ